MKVAIFALALLAVAHTAFAAQAPLGKVLQFVPPQVAAQAEEVAAQAEEVAVKVVQSIEAASNNEENEKNRTPKKPAFCNNLDCPDFTVKATGKGYELREYQPSQWVTTEITGVDYREASSIMFRRLFRYISGSNDASRKIAMTAPVVNRIIPGQGPNCQDNYTMSFYVSPTEGSPPKPTEDGVSLTSMSKGDYYVTSYGGYATTETIIEHARTMGDTLRKEGKKFTHSFYYAAGYDAPFKLFNRHNEVWFIAN